MAAANSTPPSASPESLADGGLRAATREQLTLPALRLALVTPILFPGRAVVPLLAVLFGGQVERRRRRCAARGPWVCCVRHRRRYREAFGCQACTADNQTADVTTWRAPARPTRKAHKPYSLGTTFTRKQRAESQALEIHRLPVLPASYGECKTMPRPCYFFRCRHNLWLDVNPESGAIKLNFPGLEPDEVQHTCSLDAALDGAPSDDPEDRVMHTLEQIGQWMNVTTVRAGQLVTEAAEEAAAKLGERRQPDMGTDEDDDLDDDGDGGGEGSDE